MPEKMLISFGPRKILDIPKRSVAIVMKTTSFNKIIEELSRVQDELEKGKATIVRKVVKGAKLIYIAEEDHAGIKHVRGQGSTRRGLRAEKRGKKQQ